MKILVHHPLKGPTAAAKKEKMQASQLDQKKKKGPVNLGEGAVPAHVVRVSPLSPQTL